MSSMRWQDMGVIEIIQMVQQDWKKMRLKHEMLRDEQHRRDEDVKNLWKSHEDLRLKVMRMEANNVS